MGVRQWSFVSKVGSTIQNVTRYLAEVQISLDAIGWRSQASCRFNLLTCRGSEGVLFRKEKLLATL